MTARDYFKKMLADALEQNCILLEQLDAARAEIERLTAETEEKGDRDDTVD